MHTLRLSLIVVVLISTLGLGWLFDSVYEQYYSPEPSPNAIDVLRELGENLAKAANNSPNSDEFLSNWPNKKHYSIVLLYKSESSLPSYLLEQIQKGEPVLLETSKSMSYHYFLPAKNQILVLRSPVLISQRVNSPVNYVFTAAFYVMLILIFLLWAYPLVSQLLSLRLAAKSFGEGKLDKRIAQNSISYIQDIELEFNNMAQRIQSLVGDVKLLSTAVSHDLRTPLARIRFGIDTLQEVDDKELRKELEEQLGDDVDEMTSLVETLLNYARLDQNMLEIKKEPVVLSVLIQDCIKRKQSKNVNITFINEHKEKPILADQKYICMVMNNLLQNAINYGRGKVLVELCFDSGAAIVSISDDGNGVPADLHQKIINPFFRGENSANGTKGHGIGLAIVKRILDWHNGELSISNAVELSGAMFSITLPVKH